MGLYLYKIFHQSDHILDLVLVIRLKLLSFIFFRFQLSFHFPILPLHLITFEEILLLFIQEDQSHLKMIQIDRIEESRVQYQCP